MTDLPRRDFVGRMAGVGAAASAYPLADLARRTGAWGPEITVETILEAALAAGLELDRDQAEAMLRHVRENVETYAELRSTPLGNALPVPLHFDPRVPTADSDPSDGSPTSPLLRLSSPVGTLPEDPSDLAFLPVRELAHLLETGRVRPSELTDLYLSRLGRHGPRLNCVVHLTAQRAREQAALADEEIARGDYRGPLHGIPYGVKDIIAVAEFPTTWGAEPFREQVFDEDASVVRRLDEAGAILVAKLTTGELAFGDRWFGGRTNNPWNPEEGSSGSSAGSAAATAAGLVGFAIGTDTGGSILSPAERCGVVGLRPTFGRVSRHGVMAAGTTLDKVGPMCRTAEGAAIVLDAIAGPDGLDLSVPDEVPTRWDAEADVGSLRIGVHASAFEAETGEGYRAHHERVLSRLESMGAELRPAELPVSDLNFFIEFVERAAGFTGFVRSGGTADLIRSVHGDELRAYHLVPAVEYLQANRKRWILMRETHGAMSGVDVLVSTRTHWDPERSLNPLTSLTGHPVVAVPTGLSPAGTPMGITLTGHLYREGEILSVARRLMQAVGSGNLRPPGFG